MTFGWEPEDWGSVEDEAIRIAHGALDMGINFFDTADVYARGGSEIILGKALRSRRDGVVLASKCLGTMSDHDPNAKGASRRHIIEACEASLKRLQTEYIDLYQIHRPDPEVPVDETLRAFDDLIRSGKVRYAGCSTFAAWQACEAHYVAKMLGINGFCCEQPPYNLFDRRIERELLPFIRTYDWGCIPWSPLAGGQLSGKYLRDDWGRSRYSKSDPKSRVTNKTQEKTRQLKRIADRIGISLTTLSLAWVSQQAGITSPIIGARSVEQLEEGARACQFVLPEKVLKQIDAVCAPESCLIDYYSAPFGPNKRPIV